MFEFVKTVMGNLWPSGLGQPWAIGDKFTCPEYIAKNPSPVLDIMPSSWGTNNVQLLIESDELFPLVNRTNPRRRYWVHESWLRRVA